LFGHEGSKGGQINESLIVVEARIVGELLKCLALERPRKHDEFFRYEAVTQNLVQG